MASLKYLDPITGEYKKVSSSGGGTSIPASDTEPATGNYWLDTSAEGGTYYTAGETLSSSTKTALGIAEDATPDVAFAEIGRQLSETQNAVESTDYPGCYYRTVNGVTEWINPPMVIGVEYRTSERYIGKPVYVKVVDCGIMADTKYVQHGVSDLESIVRYFGVNGGQAMPQIWEHSLTNRYTAFVNAVRKNDIALSCGTDAAGDGKVAMFYTKTTD